MYSCPEYNNNYTNTYTEYNNLKKYNTLFAQKLPPSVPSMNFPVILEQNNKYGYNALTHDSESGSNYYTVKSGYGSSCTPHYYVAKCPNNKFIRTFLPGPTEIVSPSTCPVENELISEGYASPDMLNKLKSLNLIVFYDKNCIYSKNLLEEISNNIGSTNIDQYVELKDISVGNNEQELTNLGGYAVPFIYSKKTNNSVTGYSSLSNIINNISVSKNNMTSNLSEKIKSLKLIIYTMNNCMYCNKLKELLKDEFSNITYKDGLDPKNRNEVQQARGFPFIVSKKTGKTTTGLPNSKKDLVESLS